jgi:NitT/TauT family transport system substrate-binding protein/putative hydroxymethylpyrimidine transport system substrate-binding protein
MTSPDRPIAGTVAAVLATGIAAVGFAACGDDQDREAASGRAALEERTEATLVLDFVPNAVHTGIYCALENGYYDENSVELEIVEPTSTSDTLKLIDQGRAAFGIADGIDVGQQIDRGLSAKAIMAVVQRPLGGVITLAEAGIRSPRDLEGRTVGVTGVPSDGAVLDTVVSDDGGDPAAVGDVTIGFNTVPALRSGRVDAITGYPPADGTALEQRGEAVRSFVLDEWGGPRYPGLVVFSTRETIERDRELMRAFVEATVRGYEDTLDDPERCLDALIAAVPEIDPELAEAQLDAYLPLFESGGRRYGLLEPRRIGELLRFLRDTGLAREPISARRYATNEFVQASSR